MNSKLLKQKQILSMLNAQPEVGNREADILDAPETDFKNGKSASHNSLLHQVYQFHKNIIQNINAGLITIDLQGVVTFANKIAAQLLGYEVKELMESDIRKFFASEDEGGKFIKLCTLTGKKIDDWETRFICKDKKEIIVGINASYLQDETNDFEGVVLLLRDLTEIHHLRSQVERMERLALLGELSAGIAHEIRNPLAGIKAASQLLENQFEADDLSRELTQRVVREVDKANRLLKEFFKFARPPKPKLGFYDVQRIIDSVYLLLAPRLKTLGIKFESDFQSKLPKVYVDETQIEQVILNLFMNAIDAMSKGGILKVCAMPKKVNPLGDKERQAVSANQELQYILIEVTDNGTGIEPKNMKKIFNPFFTTKPNGLGLGLSICSRLIEENKGKIDVLSHKGPGTTFILALPTFILR